MTLCGHWIQHGCKNKILGEKAIISAHESKYFLTLKVVKDFVKDFFQKMFYMNKSCSKHLTKMNLSCLTELLIDYLIPQDLIHKHPNYKVVKSFFTILTGFSEIQLKPIKYYGFLGFKITKSNFCQLFHNKIL